MRLSISYVALRLHKLKAKQSGAEMNEQLDSGSYLPFVHFRMSITFYAAKELLINITSTETQLRQLNVLAEHTERPRPRLSEQACRSTQVDVRKLMASFPSC